MLKEIRSAKDQAAYNDFNKKATYSNGQFSVDVNGQLLQHKNARTLFQKYQLAQTNIPESFFANANLS